MLRACLTLRRSSLRQRRPHVTTVGSRGASALHALHARCSLRWAVCKSQVSCHLTGLSHEGGGTNRPILSVSHPESIPS